MSDAAAAPALSTYQDESTFEFQKVEKQETDRSYLGPGWRDESKIHDLIRDYYSIDDLTKHLSQVDTHGVRKFKKITLQFPDSLVSDSAIIVQQLQDSLSTLQPVVTETKEVKENCKKTCENCKCSDPTETEKEKEIEDNTQHVWILADTAYSSCCIDEVAAEHVNSNIVVHFGDACLNAIQKLAAVYVFGKPHLLLESIIAKFRETYPDIESKVVLMADTPHTRYLPELYTALKPTYPNLAFADINLERANDATIIGFQSSQMSTSSKLRFSNRILVTDQDVVEDELIDYNLFHITTPQPPHLLYLASKFSQLSLYSPSDNTIDQGPFPSLMKRYRYMHIARTAGTIGILVNTLSLRNTNEVIKKVSQQIRDADKKSYMFVVGKPNVAKLANFESIDIWCILGCGQGGIVLDTTNEFFKPIVTPYELELALSPEVSWTGKWVTEFEKILEDGDQENDQEETESDDKDETLDGEDEAPEFNPVTGKYVSNSRPLRSIQHLEIDSVSQSVKEEGQLVKAFSQAVTIKGTVSTSAIHLQNREWTGLGSDFTDDYDEAGALVEEGRDGIARGYDFDVEDRVTKTI